MCCLAIFAVFAIMVLAVYLECLESITNRTNHHDMVCLVGFSSNAHTKLVSVVYSTILMMACKAIIVKDGQRLKGGLLKVNNI